MKLTSTDIIALMEHYAMTKNSRLCIFGSNSTSTNKLCKAGLVADSSDDSINRPLTPAGLELAQLIIDYTNGA